MTYAEYAEALATMAATNQQDQSFALIVPRAIDDAERRIYRELQLLTTVARDGTLSFTTGASTLALPATPRFVTVQQVNAITPAGTAPDLGTRNALAKVSRDWLDLTWGSSTGAARPRFYAMLTDQTIQVGPWPDAAYRVEFVGTTLPAPLSAQNPTTYLSLYLPDLFLAASMIFVAGYQRNFGQVSDDPKMAQSWEAQYQAKLASAQAEEALKKARA